MSREDIIREDIIRRRALQVIGAKLIRRVGDVKVVDGISGPLREAFVHFDYATTRGEAHLDLVERRAAGETVLAPLRRQERLAALREAFRDIVADDSESGGSDDPNGVAAV